MEPKTIVIIGAGPAGLTAALELLRRSPHRVVVLEASDGVGGISRTFRFKGNLIDLGGHRFFSKSQRVMDWWQQILPIEQSDIAESVTLAYQNRTTEVRPSLEPARGDVDQVMLVRKRVSRILYRRKFFEYPLSLSPRTIQSLGLLSTAMAGLSFLRAQIAPRQPERTLQDYIINRFGRYLYGAFFRDYTRKVWGVPCDEIPADWGAQRIKGLSITSLLTHATRKLIGTLDRSERQHGVSTSLIERFLYPKRGPGQMWEEVARQVVALGGEIRLNCRVCDIDVAAGRVRSVRYIGPESPDGRSEDASVVFSSMAVADLASALGPAMPPDVSAVASALPYRDFMTVGLLLRHIRRSGKTIRGRDLQRDLPDNWIYIQEPDVMVGRLQVFNNWSPYMVADADTVWVGLEYFLNAAEPLWGAPDEQIVALATKEMTTLGFIEPGDVLDAVVIRQAKAYPAYFGTYAQFEIVRRWLMTVPNLALLGRNGQHRYNNQDHSMLTAMQAVDLLVSEQPFDAIWEVNTESEFHEEHTAGR